MSKMVILSLDSVSTIRRTGHNERAIDIPKENLQALRQLQEYEYKLIILDNTELYPNEDCVIVGSSVSVRIVLRLQSVGVKASHIEVGTYEYSNIDVSQDLTILDDFECSESLTIDWKATWSVGRKAWFSHLALDKGARSIFLREDLPTPSDWRFGIPKHGDIALLELKPRNTFMPSLSEAVRHIIKTDTKGR